MTVHFWMDRPNFLFLDGPCHCLAIISLAYVIISWYATAIREFYNFGRGTYPTWKTLEFSLKAYALKCYVRSYAKNGKISTWDFAAVKFWKFIDDALITSYITYITEEYFWMQSTLCIKDKYSSNLYALTLIPFGFLDICKACASREYFHVRLMITVDYVRLNSEELQNIQFQA